MKVLTPITDLSQLPKCFGKPEVQPVCIKKCLIWAACVRYQAAVRKGSVAQW